MLYTLRGIFLYRYERLFQERDAPACMRRHQDSALAPVWLIHMLEEKEEQEEEVSACGYTMSKQSDNGPHMRRM